MSSLMELLKSKKNALSNNKRTLRPTKDRNRYRILPGWRPGDQTFWHDFGQHFIRDTLGNVKAAYICTDKTYGKPCAICSGIERAIPASDDDLIIKTLTEAKSSKRILLNVLDVEGENPTTPQVLEVSPTVFTAIIGLFEEWGEELLDPEKGQDIIIGKTGTGLMTRYTVQIASKSKPINPSVLKSLVNLDDFVAQESAELANRAMNALGDLSGGVLALPPGPRGAGALASTAENADWGAKDVTDVSFTEELAKSAPATTEVDIDSILGDLEFSEIVKDLG